MTRVEQCARSDDERLGLVFSHPVWIVRAFRRALAAEGRADELEALLTADNAVAAGDDGGPARPGRGPGGRPPHPVLADRLPPRRRRPRVDDPRIRRAAAGAGRGLAARRARAQRAPSRCAQGERWLDLCAGPGGKTAVLAAEALAGGAVLEANEISPARAGLVRRAIAGIPLDVDVSEQDGRVRAAESPGDVRPDPRRRAVHRAGRAAPPARGALAQVARRRAGAHRAADRAAERRHRRAAARRHRRLRHLLAASRRDRRRRRRRASGVRRRDRGARRPGRHRGAVGHRPEPLPPADGSGRAQLWPHRHNTDAMSITLLRRV